MPPVTVGLDDYEKWDSEQPSVLIMIVFWLFLGSVIRSLPLSLQRFLPYTVIVLIVGLGVGYYGARCTDDGITCYPFGIITEKAPSPGISPVMLQLAVLPPLIFSELFHTDIYMFRKVMGQALLLAFPGVFLCTVILCVFVVYWLPQYFDWYTGMMFGAMLAASDPVAVLAGMKELGADPRLTTIISGESIMNDGCAVVLFMPFFAAAFDDESVEAGGIVIFTIVNILGAAALGLFYCFVTVMVLRLCRKEMPVVVSIIVVAPFFCYYTAVLLGTSGILSLVPFALGLRLFSNNFLWGHIDEASLAVWELIEYMVNTFTFVLSGVYMVVNLWSSDIDGNDVLDLLYVYLISLAARAFTILFFFPVLRCMGLGFDWRDAVLTWVAGLRGVVGLSMAMIVHFSARDGHELERTGQRFMFHMGGVYFLTAVINATLSTPLCHYLGLDVKPRARILAMVNVSDACCQHVISLAQNSDGRENALVDKAKEISKICHKTAGLGESDSTDSVVDLDGERRRMLDVCTLRYRGYFEAGQISMSACLALDHVTKNAMFRCGTEIQRWSVLGRLCAKLLSFSELPYGLGAFVLNLSAEIAWGFVEAQRGVRETLPSSPILAEVEKEEVDGSAFLELLSAEHPKAVQQMRARHLAFTARNAVMGKIHEALADGTLHADEAKVLEEMAETLKESFDGRPLESGSAAPVAQAAPEVNV
jgi:NhaP-type Na+/H+ or K+/H+ antiporter